MKTTIKIALLLGSALCFVGCSADRSVDPPIDASADNLNAGTIATELVAREVVELYNWEADEEFVQPEKAHPGDTDPQWLVIDSEFEEVSADIYHYSWRIQTGTGPFDIIRLHRVVKVGMRSQPIRARKSVFMLHGDFKDFPGCFLPGLSSPIYSNDFGIAVYFAQQGVDVWGMDQAHNSIPADETDFSSMADWDMYKYVTDTRLGLSIARDVRLITGNGYRKLVLLGYSGGSALGFAVVDEESKLPYGLRHVAAFVPVDQGVISGNGDFAAGDCGTAEYYADLVNAGEYVEPNPFPFFGEPARHDPDGPSEFIPGMTNLQAALAIAVYPYVEGFPYHFLAGEFDANGLPSGLQYTNTDLWIDFLIDAPPYFANAFSRDEYISSCGLQFAPWTANLGRVDLPVYYVAAAGGFGLVYEATLDLLTSANVSRLTVELHPADEAELDFAHIDLFIAENAPQLVWQPILDWVLSLRGASDEAHPRTISGVQ